jgi:cysteine-rich CPXCG protein
MQLAAEYTCSYCGEVVETTVDASAGETQSYVEDCAVCCRPNILRVRVDLDAMEAEILTEFEG